MKRTEIEEKYLAQVKDLEQQFFHYIQNGDGKGTLVRVIKDGKTEEDFNRLQGQTWEAFEIEMIDAGYIVIETEQSKPLTETELLAQQVTELQIEIELLKAGVF